ncbi:hypothetical protein [Roseivivax lentus]|nr:hypothetical protein [Roseivivax lentus]
MRGIWGGLAAVVGLLVLLFLALSFVGGGESAGTSAPGDSMIAPAEAPPAASDSAPATVPAE